MTWRFVRPLSSAIRPSVSQLTQNPFGGFLSNFSCCLPWAIHPDFLEIKNKTRFPRFPSFFSFSLTWYPTGAKPSKRYSSPKSLLNFFKLLLNFLLIGSHKSTILNFLNFEFMILRDLSPDFANMEPSNYFWFLLSSLNLFSIVSRKVLFWIFEILRFRLFMIFFRKFHFYLCVI